MPRWLSLPVSKRMMARKQPLSRGFTAPERCPRSPPIHRRLIRRSEPAGHAVDERHLRLPMTRRLERRSAGLCLGVAVALAAVLLCGPGVALGAIALAIVVSIGVDALARAYGSRGNEARPARLEPLMLGLAALGWMVVAVTAVLAPAGSVIHAARELHRDDRAIAIAAAKGHLIPPWPIVIDLLVGVALVCSLLAVRLLRRPASIDEARSAHAFARAQGVVAEHGEDSLAPFILRPDKSFEFAGDAVVAYGTVGETVIVSGDPVGPPRSAAAAFERLHERARDAGLHIAVYGASERHLATYRELGLRALQVGEEAVVDPATFTLEGRRVRKLRQSVHRVERRGWRIEVREGRAIEPRLEAEIEDVEAAWRRQRERLLGFAMAMGEFDPGIRPDDVHALAWSPDGRLHAVMRFMSSRQNLSLDTMRRVGDTPNGLNEALVCRTLEFARARGVGEVSLNYAGLGHLVRGPASGRLISRSLTAMLVRVLRRRFQMDRLVVFNEKFCPLWRPRYLIYESVASLPLVVLRVLQAEGYLPQRATSRPRLEDAGRRPGWPPAGAVKERLTG